MRGKREAERRRGTCVFGSTEVLLAEAEEELVREWGTGATQARELYQEQRQSPTTAAGPLMHVRHLRHRERMLAESDQNVFVTHG